MTTIARPSILDEVRDFVNNLPPPKCPCCSENLEPDGQCSRNDCMIRKLTPEQTHCCWKGCHPERWKK